MRHRARWWSGTLALAIIAVGEWVRHPVPLTAGVAAGLTALAAVLLLPELGWRRRALLAALLLLLAAVPLAEFPLSRIEHDWPAERESRVIGASRRLGDDLHAAFHRAERLAERGAMAAAADRPQAFTALARAVSGGGPEVGVAILDSTGAPWAWAGRHRLPLDAEGDSISSRSNAYYVTLEARRHSAEGRVVVATVLVWAHPAVPDRDRSVAERFRRSTGVGLEVFPPGKVPDNRDVFDYTEPTTAGPRLLFSVQPVPPEQGTAHAQTLARGRAAVSWLVVIVVVLALASVERAALRLGLLAVVLLVAARAPLGAALGVAPLFSPATFFLPVGRGALGSAGVLALAGALLDIASVWLWRRRPPRRTPAAVLALALLAVAPPAIAWLADGITPPATGVAAALWLTWEVSLVVGATAPVVTAAALLRGWGEPRYWRAIVGAALAVAASVAAVTMWSPAHGWPPWLPLLWLPALVCVALPAPRWTLVLGIAVAVGTFASLVTWDAELRGRIQAVGQDVSRLGVEPDPLALPPLERFGDELVAADPPTTATEMYVRWHESALRAQRYPAHLARWTADGRLTADLELDSLDVSTATLGALAGSLAPGESRKLVVLRRVPGVHYVLLARVPDGSVLTAAIGPRSALVAPSRLGRLLDPEARHTSRYRLELAPPSAEALPPATADTLSWARDGWVLRSERALYFPSGARTVHALIDLRGPAPLLVRGALVVILDAAALALLWVLAELTAGAPATLPPFPRLARSFRIRLAVTLAAFFLLPAVGFALWGFARLRDEARRGRDLLIAQTLRDAVLASGGLLRAPAPALQEGLSTLSRRIDADLALYGGGALAAVSAPVLRDLGVVAELMPAGAFQALGRGGDLEVTRDGPVPSLGERIGYRIVQPATPAGLAVLATPQLADESSLATKQLDLALVLLLATLAGVAAALAGAGQAARALSRPVSELRRSALALGQGRPMPLRSPDPPSEFAPVFGAFERMADDIRASQRALEEARRRTAAVLATAATGVVALDPAGRVLLANPRARELLDVELPENASLLEALGPAWAELRDVVERFLAGRIAGEVGAELSVAGRRLTVQLAAAGPDLAGVVLALNDVTDVSRAERVLAWGEMARQVAHEIKNPLTPMRLGMQHLRRAYRDEERRAEFARTLEETSDRVLGEIDRLDTIARAFSRFGAPVDQQEPLAPVDAAAVAREVVQLYGLSEEGARVRLDAPMPVMAQLRRDELKEVLVNLLENARDAGAREVMVRAGVGGLSVTDDGRGIAPELLPRIFEPRFSTTTSGSGLGLAIVRRLVESWAGRVEVASELGRGTVVTIHLPDPGR